MKPPRLVFVFYVHGDYQHYLPPLLVSIGCSYPQHHTRVFLKEVLMPDVAKQLGQVRAEVSGRFDIIEQYGGMPVSDPRHLRSARWFIRRQDIGEFDYAYIGDADFIIIREQPGLLERHVEHCRRSGLAYSNGVRPGGKRMSGLHFIEVAPYFAAISALQDRYAADPAFLNRNNEEVLYSLVTRAFGSPEAITKGGGNVYRPHHGVHLGILRDDLGREINPKWWDPCVEQFGANALLLALSESSPLPELRLFARRMREEMRAREA